jgi:hypothetical protein
MPTIKAETIGWTRYDVMTADLNGPEAADGYLKLYEAVDHVAELEAERSRRIAAGSAMMDIDDQLEDARELEKDIRSAAQYSAAVQVQYLPDAVINLPLNLRRRATELLMNDDLGKTGEISQAVVSHARSRYDAISAITPGALGMKNKALAEIDAIASYLGLSSEG